jgi:hypothetical protein
MRTCVRAWDSSGFDVVTGGRKGRGGEMHGMAVVKGHKVSGQQKLLDSIWFFLALSISWAGPARTEWGRRFRLM